MPDTSSVPKEASHATAQENSDASTKIAFDDEADFERARRGLIATLPEGKVTIDSQTVWDCSQYDFLRENSSAPDTVHPGLWRQGRLNAIHGLFEVMDGVWQVRGYDISNLTLVAGKTGWILIDVLTTAATAKACLELANEHLGARPVKAVIYTHSHADHFGGILGVTTAEEVERGQVRIIAPEGFLEEVVNENVIAGAAMARRAMYQFGLFLDPGPKGHVDNGLGKALPFSPSGLIAPTETIRHTGTELQIDGVSVIFQNTPDAEAPAEMNFWFPELRLLCMAENCTHNMHNLYPIRGAQTRDALAWSKYINEAMAMWGDKSDILIATHHWPRFGNEDLKSFLVKQRDLYRWMHDQTMRLANRGWTGAEIAEELTLPDCFSADSHTQGYYGTLSHNVRSVYNRYLGWYDANPATLHPYPQTESSKRYVNFMGGADEVIRKAKLSFEEGDYRWVAQVMNHLVFADPSLEQARHLQADALEQLGYQSESGTWRNAYLYGAHELRNGSPDIPVGRGRQIAHAMSATQLFDSIGVRLSTEALSGLTANLNWTFSDLGEQHVLGINNCAIHHLHNQHLDRADASITLTRHTLADALGGIKSFTEALKDGDLIIEGNQSLVLTLFSQLTNFRLFPIIEPHGDREI